MSEFKNSGEFATTWVGGLGLLQGEEIVRCRNCRFKAKDGDWCCRTEHELAVEPDGFCSWAKRRGDAE